jgi:hypothetical protein
MHNVHNHENQDDEEYFHDDRNIHGENQFKHQPENINCGNGGLGFEVELKKLLTRQVMGTSTKI